MITVVIILFIAFSIFFPGFIYKTRWNEAYTVLLGRDTILTIDRLGKLYNYSFSAGNLQKYLDTALPINKTNLIGWSEVDGTVKGRLTIACNCTNDTISALTEWFYGLKFNGREIQVYIPQSNLDVINQPADILLIWGYKDLNPYRQSIRNFLAAEKGVVEIMDFSDVTQINNDSIQNETFGLKGNINLSSEQKSDSFVRKPANVNDISYETYKFFYHIPIPLKTIANQTPAIPSEMGTITCSNFTQGSMTFNKTSYKFWDCYFPQSVYFDTNNNSLADKEVLTGQSFNISNYNFTLNYIDSLQKIGVAFQYPFVFNDFGNYGPTGMDILNVEPRDGDQNKIILKSDGGYPVVILNRNQISRAAWIADFSEDGYGDDEKQLLTSLIFWASNKRAIGVLSTNIKTGFLTSYINTANQDIFEVYKFNLGLGYPFSR
jgi:hypothetical protein